MKQNTLKPKTEKTPKSNQIVFICKNCVKMLNWPILKSNQTLEPGLGDLMVSGVVLVSPRGLCLDGRWVLMEPGGVKSSPMR